MRPHLLALLLLCLAASAANADDLKATSRIESVTVFPAGAEVTRVGKLKMDRGDHVLLFSDLPPRAIGNSIRVEGKATASWRSVGRQPVARSCREPTRLWQRRTQATGGRDRKTEGREGNPAGHGAGGGNAEEADCQPRAATHATEPVQQHRLASPTGDSSSASSVNAWRKHRRPCSTRRSRCVRTIAKPRIWRAS